MWQQRQSLNVRIWFQDWAHLGLESTVPMHLYSHRSLASYFSIYVKFFPQHDSSSNLAAFWYPLCMRISSLFSGFLLQWLNFFSVYFETLEFLSACKSFIPKLFLRLLWFFRRTAALFRQIRTFPQLFRFCSDPLNNSADLYFFRWFSLISTESA